MLQHTPEEQENLQYTASHCTTLQHTAKHCNKLQHTPEEQENPEPLEVPHNARHPLSPQI